jgi:hypothetical protein
MYFPALLLGLRRLGRGLLYKLFQLALVLAFGLHKLGSLRSALGGGGENAARRPAAPAIRPRRLGPGRRPRFTYPFPA